MNSQLSPVKGEITGKQIAMFVLAGQMAERGREQGN